MKRVLLAFHFKDVYLSLPLFLSMIVSLNDTFVSFSLSSGCYCCCCSCCFSPDDDSLLCSVSFYPLVFSWCSFIIILSDHHHAVCLLSSLLCNMFLLNFQFVPRMLLLSLLSPSHERETCTLTGMYTAFSTTASSSNKSFEPRDFGVSSGRRLQDMTHVASPCFLSVSFLPPTIIIIISLLFLSFIQLHRTQRFVPEISVIQSSLPWHLQSFVHHFSFVTEERRGSLQAQRILTSVPWNSTRFLCRIRTKISFIFYSDFLFQVRDFHPLATFIIMVTLEWALISHNRHQEIISRRERERERFGQKLRGTSEI